MTLNPPSSLAPAFPGTDHTPRQKVNAVPAAGMARHRRPDCRPVSALAAHWRRRLVVASSFLLAALLTVANAAPLAATEPAIVEKYRELIPQLMAEQGIPGLALAVVDETGVIWAEGFGYTGTDRRLPVTPETVFSIQSMSKTFTTLGVLRAVQAGLLDLDAPITTYLPGFTVNSIFEEHPERKITLRHLLSCTAGFTHEAPVGNNWDADATSFDAHIQSLSATWLRFPVGTGFAYSNLGFDLAAYILQTVTGQPFADYQRDHVLQPLGMANSSFDLAVITAQANRAIGHVESMPSVRLGVPMVGAGGMYASANDLARFIQFQLNGGEVDGQALLSPELLAEMRTVQFPERGQRFGYGLGVARTGWYRSRNADLFSHGGGGFGFLSDLWWLPELNVGLQPGARHPVRPGALTRPLSRPAQRPALQEPGDRDRRQLAAAGQAGRRDRRPRPARRPGALAGLRGRLQVGQLECDRPNHAAQPDFPAG
jgi:CubicO group peptidase (beta-lactamase class C family)